MRTDSVHEHARAHTHDARDSSDTHSDTHICILQLRAEVRRGIEISAGVTSKMEMAEGREAQFQQLRSEYEEQLRSMEECIKKERGARERGSKRGFAGNIARLSVDLCVFLAVRPLHILALMCTRTILITRVRAPTYAQTHADMKVRAEKERVQAEGALEKLISSVELMRDNGTLTHHCMHDTST